MLKLHEDQIPDFNEAVTILIRRAGRSARNMIAMVKENFRTGTARTGIAHCPEIVRRGNADDAVVTDAGNLLPQIGRIFILVIDGDQQLVLWQTVLSGDQVPGQFNGHFLEIIAE